MKKNKIIKIIIFIIIFLLLMILFPEKVVSASGEEYFIKDLNITVYMDDAGNATIIEKWTLQNIQENFKVFEKHINKPNDKSENINNLEFNYVKINEQNCKEVFNNNYKEPYTYFLDEGKNKINIKWYLPIENETTTVSVSYTLYNIIKKTDDNIALFCYEYLGEDFKGKIENLTISIATPDETFIEKKYGNGNLEIVDKEKAIITNSNIEGSIKYDIAMDANIFNDLEYIVKEEKEDLNFRFYFTFVFIVIIFIVIYQILRKIIIPLYKIIVEYITTYIKRYHYYKYDKKFRCRIEEYEELLKKYKYLYPPFVFNFGNKNVEYYTFFNSFLEVLIDKKIANKEKNKIIISKAALSRLDKCERDILKLFLNCPHEEDKNSYEIFTNSYNKFLEDLKYSNKFAINTVKEVYEKKYSNLFTQEFFEDCNFFEWYFNYCIYDNTKIFENKDKSYEKIMFFCFQKMYNSNESDYIKRVQSIIEVQTSNSSLETETTAFDFNDIMKDMNIKNKIKQIFKEKKQ